MIYSYVGRRIEDGGWTGVSRFDAYLRRVFPEMQSITPNQLPDVQFARGDVVIADNHLSRDIPDNVRTVVVHHGCAQAHWDREPTWCNLNTEAMCDSQRAMFRQPRRTFVAPSTWVRTQFAAYYDLRHDYGTVIVNWVPLIEPDRTRAPGRVVIGDWRDANKGADMWRRVAALLPDCEFRPCSFRTDDERIAFYRDADLYLCLSQSEGGSYSVCDAEATRLPIISTPVGNHFDFATHQTRIECDDSPEEIACKIAWRFACLTRRGDMCHYTEYTFEKWAALWRGVVDKAMMEG